MNEEQNLQYWQLVNKHVKVMIVPQYGSRSSLIYNHMGIYFYHMNYYTIPKEHLQFLHKLQPTYFQIAFEKLSVIKFQLVEIETLNPYEVYLVLIKYAHNTYGGRTRKYTVGRYIVSSGGEGGHMSA